MQKVNFVTDILEIQFLDCEASVPERHERNSGRAKEAFAFEKWGESKKVEGAGWGRGKKETLARKPLDFDWCSMTILIDKLSSSLE